MNSCVGWQLGLLRLLRLLLLRLGLLLRWLGLLKGRLGLLRLRLCRRRGSAESGACATAAHIATASVDGPREMIRQAEPARGYHDEKLGILKCAAF